MLAVAFLKRSERDTRVDGAAVVEVGVGFEVLAVYVEKMLAPERLRRGCDGGVQLAMQFIERIATERRVSDLGCHMCFGRARLQPRDQSLELTTGGR